MCANLSSADIDRIAAQWAAREDLRPLDTAEEHALDVWLAQDIRHLGAYGKAKAVLHRTVCVQEGAPLSDAVEDAGTVAHGSPTRRRMMVAMAASVAAMAGGGALLLRDRSPPEKRFSTRRGEIRSLPLEDGSTVMLNTASQIAVLFLPEQRIVRLLAGEAFFQVARDAARPFLVQTAGRVVQAVGTAFSVRSTGEGVGVMVREGRIRYERQPDGGMSPAFLMADAETEIIDDRGEDMPRMQHRSGEEMDRKLAWLDDKIVFDETTLGDAAAQFHRYSEIPLLMTPEVRKLRVSGRYTVGDPEAFARAASMILDLDVERTSQGIKITTRK